MQTVTASVTNFHFVWCYMKLQSLLASDATAHFMFVMFSSFFILLGTSPHAVISKRKSTLYCVLGGNGNERHKTAFFWFTASEKFASEWRRSSRWQKTSFVAFTVRWRIWLYITSWSGLFLSCICMQLRYTQYDWYSSSVHPYVCRTLVLCWKN